MTLHWFSWIVVAFCVVPKWIINRCSPDSMKTALAFERFMRGCDFLARVIVVTVAWHVLPSTSIWSPPALVAFGIIGCYSSGVIARFVVYRRLSQESMQTWSRGYVECGELTTLFLLVSAAVPFLITIGFESRRVTQERIALDSYIAATPGRVDDGITTRAVLVGTCDVIEDQSTGAREYRFVSAAPTFQVFRYVARSSTESMLAPVTGCRINLRYRDSGNSLLPCTVEAVEPIQLPTSP